MQIYFAGSIRGGRDDADLYHRIIEQLQAYGTVLTEHVGAKDLSAGQSKILMCLQSGTRGSSEMTRLLGREYHFIQVNFRKITRFE